MPDVPNTAAAPAAAPAAPAARPAAPAAAPSAPKAPAPTPTKSTSFAVGGGAPAPSAPKAPPSDAAEGAEVSGDAPTKPKRDPYLWKRQREDGTEEEIDIAEAIASYKHRVRIDKEDREVPLEELGKSYERVGASMKRFEQAKKLERDASERMQAAEAREKRIVEALSDPRRALGLARKALGDQLFYQSLEQELREQVRLAKMTPEQRAQHDAVQRQETQRERLTRELEERKRVLDEREAKVTAAETERHVERARVAVTQALTAAALPINGTTTAMVAERMASAIRAGAPLTLPEAVAEVRDELRSMLGAFSENPSALREMLGDSGAEALRRAEVERLEGGQPGRRVPQPAADRPPAPAARPGAKRPRTLEDFQEQLRQTNEGRRR